MKLDNLYQLRTQGNRYITQRELSKLSGYTQTYISLIETKRANPSERCVKAILDAVETLRKRV
jgi:predicted transcriptional regulator